MEKSSWILQMLFYCCWLFTGNGLEHICFHKFIWVLDPDDYGTQCCVRYFTFLVAINFIIISSNIIVIIVTCVFIYHSSIYVWKYAKNRSLRRSPPCRSTSTKFCMRGHILDISLGLEFQKDWLENVGAVVGRNFGLPIDKALFRPHKPYDAYCQPCKWSMKTFWLLSSSSYHKPLAGV